MRRYTFTELPANIASHLATNAGVIMNYFDPKRMWSRAEVKEHIMFATGNGIQHQCVPTYNDMFDDVDNAPKDTKQGKQLEGWETTLSTTGYTYTPETIKSSLGAATIDSITDGVQEGLNVKRITPNDTLSEDDFKDLWYVTDWNKGNGFVAMVIYDALSDGGFSHQSTDNGKGQVSVSYKGHRDAEDLDRPPVEYFVVDTTGVDGVYDVKQLLSDHVTTDYDGRDVVAGDDLEINYTVDDGYEIEAVTVTVGKVPVSGAYDNGKVTVNDVNGDVVITVTDKQEG